MTAFGTHRPVMRPSELSGATREAPSRRASRCRGAFVQRRPQQIPLQTYAIVAVEIVVHGTENGGPILRARTEATRTPRYETPNATQDHERSVLGHPPAKIASECGGQRPFHAELSSPCVVASIAAPKNRPGSLRTSSRGSSLARQGPPMPMRICPDGVVVASAPAARRSTNCTA
jgi:hypothetical protein